MTLRTPNMLNVCNRLEFGKVMSILKILIYSWHEVSNAALILSGTTALSSL